MKVRNAMMHMQLLGVTLSVISLYGLEVGDGVAQQHMQMSPENMEVALDELAAQGLDPRQIENAREQLEGARRVKLYLDLMNSRAFVEKHKDVVVKDVRDARQIALQRTMSFDKRTSDTFHQLSYMKPLARLLNAAGHPDFVKSYANGQNQSKALPEEWSYELEKWKIIMAQFMDDPLVVACSKAIPTIIQGRTILKNAIENQLEAPFKEGETNDTAK